MLSTSDDNYTSSVIKSLNFNHLDLAASVDNFQRDRGPASSYWKPAKKVATNDPSMKSKAPNDPIMGELE